MSARIEFIPEEKSYVEQIKEDLNLVKESSDKVRRGIFAKHAELAKKYLDLHERMQIIERNICQRS